MAREKNSSDKPTPKKTAAKKSAANTAAVKKPVIEQVAAAAAAAEYQLSTANGHKAQPSAAELHEAIRRRAYELYHQRGGQHGSDKADWHRAEVEVRSNFKA